MTEPRDYVIRNYPTDETIKALRQIEGIAWTVQARARWIVQDVDRLMQRPDWPTLAEDELDRALRAVTMAQEVLTKAVEKMKDKPVEPRIKIIK